MPAKTTYEMQARLSVALGLIGGLSTLVCIYCMLARFDYQTFLVTYAQGGKRFLVIVASMLFALAAGGIGFMAGLNSAGQRLNKQNRLSWTGFFLSAAVVALALSCGIFFYFARNAVVGRQG